ncbi:MAG: hypothetical protein Q8L48_25955 [Archangium sp.]|nr:hypothetical protein [Archangium sp.]
MAISRIKPPPPKTIPRPVSTPRPAPRQAPQPPKSRFEPPKPKGPSLDGQRPAVTRDEAIKRARELLEGPVKESKQADGSIVVEDAPYVNDAADVNGKRADEAARQIADNVALEGEALDKLSARDRARYLSVKKTLLEAGEGKPQGDPVAALALQTMLLEGKLDTPLLTNLSKLNQQELAPGIDRQQLLSDVVQEVAVPEAIAQRNRGTCVPTSIEIQLVQQNPAEYVRLIAGLATPAGEVTTAGGDVLKREDGVLEDGTSRSLSQKLLAPALMELGDGLADYNNEEDKHVGGTLDGKSGLTAAQADVVLESLYGHDFAFQTTGSNEEKKAGTDFVLQELDAGRDVLVGIKWGDGGHKVLVTGTETRDGVDYVKIINPWGREELIPRDDFEARLRNVNYDPAAPIRDVLDRIF